MAPLELKNVVPALFKHVS
jgi:hypothetical protein